jgi:transcription initiation factor TFIID TATA-box-binding protein
MEIEKKSNSNKKRSLTYIIQNIVVKVDLNPNPDSNLNLELEILSEKIKNADYDKKRFPGLFLKMIDPKCVAIIFRSAKIILSGLKSFSDIDIIISRIVGELKSKGKIYIDIHSIKSEIVNIVITANLYDKINLDLAAIKLENTIFEPEIFPALIYKSKVPVKCVFLVFNNGKIVLTGVKKRESIETALIHFGKLLKVKELFMKS